MSDKQKVPIALLTGSERTHWINLELTQGVFNVARDKRFATELALI